MSNEDLFPILGTQFNRSDYVEIDLSIGSRLLEGWTVGDQEQLGERIRQYVQRRRGLIGYGGYLEKRRLYTASEHFTGESGQRNIHLGVDFWGTVGQCIHAPMDGRIHSFGYNAGRLDYGVTLILAHNTRSGLLHTLYGHLSRKDLEGLEVGRFVLAGEVIGHIGPPKDNGGWAPHLHFQSIREMGAWQGDFPGVCIPSEAAAYRMRCPDPMQLVLLDRG